MSDLQPPAVALYDFTVRSNPNGSDTATFEGLEVTSRNGSIPKLARAMLAAGYSEGTWSANAGSIFGSSLVAIAEITYQDGRIVAWAQNPMVTARASLRQDMPILAVS